MTSSIYTGKPVDMIIDALIAAGLPLKYRNLIQGVYIHDGIASVTVYELDEHDQPKRDHLGNWLTVVGTYVTDDLGQPEDLRKHFPPELLQRYVNGEFSQEDPTVAYDRAMKVVA
jgi:hypothetical protein